MILLESVTDKLQAVLGEDFYIVGGAVRDYYLSRKIFDIDISTSLMPDEVITRLRSLKIKPYLIGKRYGTIGCFIEQYDVQITTFRKEAYNQLSRKPIVEFTNDVREDLRRRDFTINAIAYKDGVNVDPYNGMGDLTKKVVRSVGEASVRFNEDPLRMLRAYRFVSELNFSLDKKTSQAIQSNAHLISVVSKERIAIEFDKVLMGDNYKEAVDLFIKSRLFDCIFPELLFAKSTNVYSSNLDAGISILERWTYFLEALISQSQPAQDREILRIAVEHIAVIYKWSKFKSRYINQKIKYLGNHEA